MDTPPQNLSAEENFPENSEVERISLFSKSEADILKLVYSIEYRAPEHDDTSFDVNALFSDAQNTITGAIQVSDSTIVEEATGFDQADTTKASFSSQSCNILLNSFGCKMSCETPGSEIAFESRAQDILTKLSYYPCEAQAVFALVAFASEFEEYSDSLQRIAKPVEKLLKHKGAVVELNNLVMATLQVIGCLLELEKLISGDADSEPKLTMAIRDFTFHAYWSIITLVACATQLSNFLTSNEEPIPYNLSQFTEKINSNLNKIRDQLAICRHEKEEANAKKKFGELLGSAPGEIAKVFESLVLFKHKAYPQAPIISVGPTDQEDFNTQVLEGKRVLFYISTLDNVCDRDISSLKEIYDEIEKNKEEFKILWIPIVEDWSEDRREEQFKEWRSKMPWYAVQYFSPPAIGYLRRENYIEDNPTGLVMTQHGKLVNSSAFDGIPKEGAEAISYLKHDYLKMEGKAQVGFSAQSDKIFRDLVFPKGAKHVLFQGSSDTELSAHEKLYNKNILLFLSDVDISDGYIDKLKEIYEDTRRQESHRIVWVPIVKQWTHEKQVQFKNKRSKMPWYTVKLFSAIADLRYMEETWNFAHKPTLVVMDKQGNVDNTNAFPMIFKRGMDAFPFRTGKKIWPRLQFTIA